MRPRVESRRDTNPELNRIATIVVASLLASRALGSLVVEERRIAFAASVAVELCARPARAAEA